MPPVPPRPGDLIYAARWGSPQAVKDLLARGANINEKDALGSSALIYSVRRSGRIEIARLLIEKGALINDVDNNGNTALILASYDNNVPVVRLLIENNASLDNKNRSGYTALNVAENWGHGEIARIIKDTVAARKMAAEKARIDAAHQVAVERQERLKKKKQSGFRP